MSRARRLQFVVALAAGGLALVGCASMRVTSFVERGTDVTRYRTYDWAPAGERATGDPRLDGNPFFQERGRTAAEKELAARGFERSTSGGAELLLHYHASITQQLDVRVADGQYEYCDDCGPSVYDAGTLLFDLVDARTNRLIWRGWAEGSMAGAIDNQEWMEARVDEAVARIMGTLPRTL